MKKTVSVNCVSEKTMAATDAAYFAGFLDGEGTVALVKTAHKRTRAGFQYQACLSLANTNLAGLEHLVDRCGNGRIIVTAAAHPTHKLGYAIRFTANQIRHLLPQALPYLVLKKEQAKLLLRFLALRTVGHHLTDDEYREAEEIRLQLKALNQRGTTAIATQAEWQAIRPSKLGNNQYVKATT